VFCGSSPGVSPAFAAAAAEVGTGLARRGLGLVYGGASVGRATGVITEALAGHEIAHGELSDIHVVRTMHERKALMSSLSDAFVMLPGGFGTLEEFMESVTWAQLGLHDKRCGVLNVDGYFDDLLRFLGHAVMQGFIEERQVAGVIVTDDVDALLEAVVGAPSSRVTAP
jgi:uncharacterized protein (TIGR00730 family)